MRRPKRILLALLAVVSGLLYVWVAAVRAVPGVRRRKAAARRAGSRLMERWTRFVLHHRFVVLAAWGVAFVVAGAASSQLSDLLTNRFTLPGTDSQRAEQILQDHFGQRSTGIVHARRRERRRRRRRRSCRRRGRRPRAPPRSCRREARLGACPLGDSVVAAQIVSELDPADAKGQHRGDARGRPGRSRARQLYLTGQAATEHDLDPVFAEDLKKGELYLGDPDRARDPRLHVRDARRSSLPFVFALVTIPTTLGIIWIFANYMELTTYLTNLVSLIGLGIAIDYSLLMVYRFREELRKRARTDEAIVTTMDTAGRAVVFSGTAVAIGLALLLFMPLPFMRGFGVGGLIIPTVSVIAALTFLPVLLSLVGRRLDRVRLLPKSWIDRRADHEHGFWARLAHWIMRRPWPVAIGDDRVPAPARRSRRSRCSSGPGSNEGIPKSLEAVQGLDVLAEAVGAGATAPTAIVIDTGRAGGGVEPGGRRRGRRA